MVDLCDGLHAESFCWCLLVLSTACHAICACVARSMEIMLELPSSYIVRVCVCTDNMRNGPSARRSNLLYVVFAIACAEVVAVANNINRSTDIILHGAILSFVFTSLSWCHLYHCSLRCACLSVRAGDASNLFCIARLVALTVATRETSI